MGPDFGDLAVEANAFRTVKSVTETCRLSKETIWGGGWGTDQDEQQLVRQTHVQAIFGAKPPSP